MDKTKRRKKVIKIVVIAGVAVICIGGIGAVVRGKLRSAKAASTVTDSMKSYEVKTGTISTTVSGTGTLAADDVENIDLLSLVAVDAVYVKAGDTVQEGDILASVDPVSVMTALKTLQDEMDDLDDEIEDEREETISSGIKSGVSGGVIGLGMTAVSGGDGVIRTSASGTVTEMTAGAPDSTTEASQETQQETGETGDNVSGGSESTDQGLPGTDTDESSEGEQAEPQKENIAALQPITVTAPQRCDKIYGRDPDR